MPVTIHGDGTITGLAVGGLPNGTVDADTLASNAVTSTKLASGAITESSLPSGTLIQIVNHSTTTRTNPTITGVDPITATSGAQYTSFNFTPKLANSKLLLTSSTLMFGERSNVGDTMIAFATHGGDTIIGSWCNYAGYDMWSGYHDMTFGTFNHLFDSWGTSQKAISIRCCNSNGQTQIGINYPPGNNTYMSQYNSPNRHEVTFTMTEFKA